MRSKLCPDPKWAGFTEGWLERNATDPENPEGQWLLLDSIDSVFSWRRA
jgi:hypothetical protein